MELGCAILDDGELSPGATALKSFSDTTFEYILEHGGCPAWQSWEICKKHSLPRPPMGECRECEAGIDLEEQQSWSVIHDD